MKLSLVRMDCGALGPYTLCYQSLKAPGRLLATEKVDQ